MKDAMGRSGMIKPSDARRMSDEQLLAALRTGRNVLAPPAPLAPGFSAREFADKYGISLQAANAVLIRLTKTGLLSRVYFEGAYAYYEYGAAPALEEKAQ